MAYLGLLWVAALLFVHVEGRVMASQQQGTKEPPLPLPILNSDKDCGVPYALCGGSIPDGIKCPNVSICFRRQRHVVLRACAILMQLSTQHSASTVPCLLFAPNHSTAGRIMTKRVLPPSKWDVMV
jgi:hypothetical protein